ncbi:MAG: hypothetical protein ACK40H_08100 [Sphingomonadaceae bacterium]
MHRNLLLMGALAATILASPAQAAHTPAAVFSEARGTAQSSNGFVSGVADVWFRSGAFVGTPITGGGNGGSGLFDAGPLVAGATTVWATTQANAPTGGRSDTHASASLDRGELKVVVDNLAIAPFGSSGFASARMADAIWFTNVTSSYLPVGLAMRIDGSIVGSPVRAEGFSFLGLGTVGAGCATDGRCITPDPTAPFIPFSDALYGIFDQFAAPGSKLYFFEQLSGQTSDEIPFWSFTYGASHDPDSGFYDYTKSITLWVPPGETTLTLDGWFRMTVCAGNVRCDFGNTSRIRFGNLPAGLSFTSQSGVFLAGLAPPPPDDVPAPGGPGMLLAGLGLLAAMGRRRSRA